MSRKMPTTVYISSYSGDAARELATRLRKEGHIVVSTWHDEDTPSVPQRKDWSTTGAGEEEKRLGAATNFAILKEAARVFIAQCDGNKHPGGKHVELGWAIGLAEGGRRTDLRILLFGQPENGMQYHPAVKHVKDWDELLAELDKERLEP